MTGPIPVRVTRYRCPHCARSYTRPVRTREHMARCWLNPAARGCKTCKNFEPPTAEEPDYCDAGVDLRGRPQCTTCHGFGQTFHGLELGASECADCGGDGAEIRPGPIVHCDLWEAAP